ncbi:hypothetical protein ACFWAD_29830 [Rhodococcus sp. NPDC059969]|uniref:hypothetical protein n=1 Tax=Rhodococcus sp. NPDC059969 TaxID=3347018 RepID=UPI00366C7E50
MPGWHGHPWLRRSRALVLDASRRARLGDFTVSYDDDFGLRELLLIRNGLGSGSLEGCERSGGGRAASVAVGAGGPAAAGGGRVGGGAGP